MKSQILHTSPKTIVRKTDTPPEEVWSFQTGIGIDVKFGMPKYNCRYHGICRLDVDESDLTSPEMPLCGTGKGWLFIPRPEYCLICFDKRSMTAVTRETHFQGEYFLLEDNIPFSEKLVNKVGFRVDLLAGRYRILEKKMRYGVLFGIACSNLNISML